MATASQVDHAVLCENKMRNHKPWDKIVFIDWNLSQISCALTKLWLKEVKSAVTKLNNHLRDTDVMAWTSTHVQR